jgi:heptosyltransferase II
MSFSRKRSKDYKSFLVINPFGIGDVLFSTPLIRNLSEQFPKARIYYLANSKTAPILANHPLIKRVFIYDRDEFVKEQRKSFWKGIKKYLGFIGQIRKEKIQACLDLSLNTPFGLMAMLAGINDRFGLDYKNRGLFLNKKLKIPGFCDRHVVDYYLSLLNLLGKAPRRCCLEVYSDAKSRSWAEDFLKNNHIKPDELIIGIAPCGGGAFGKDAYVKRWPEQRFAELIDKLTTQFKAKVFIFAGPDERNQVRKIMENTGSGQAVFEFTDRSLPETVALVEKCRLFIGNDTGPLRFADALGKKVIALFGPVDEKIYGPYPFEGGRTAVLSKNLPCRPCYSKFKLKLCSNDRKCLTGIEVEEVLQSARRML